MINFHLPVVQIKLVISCSSIFANFRDNGTDDKWGIYQHIIWQNFRALQIHEISKKCGAAVTINKFDERGSKYYHFM